MLGNTSFVYFTYSQCKYVNCIVRIVLYSFDLIPPPSNLNTPLCGQNYTKLYKLYKNRPFHTSPAVLSPVFPVESKNVSNNKKLLSFPCSTSIYPQPGPCQATLGCISHG